MILMTGYALGEVPYSTVYINGIVRDIQGRKMSKSLDNGGDPIVISQKYGADALRMFYAMSTAPGTDSRLDENKIKGFKHFANKIWNITRFILTYEDTLGIKYDEKYSSWTEKDSTLLKEQNELIATITKEIEEYKFHLAAEKIYLYTWSTFADVILEESKIIFAGKGEIQAGTQAEKESRAQFLFHTLRTLIKVIHPFMPHITEELWSLINSGKGLTEKTEINYADLLMIQKWPR
jgi:valyl-tRNA synthetase